MSDVPDDKVKDTQEDFENLSQSNAAETSEAQGMRNMNRKRTYDLYQDLDVARARALDSLFLQHVQSAQVNLDLITKQAIRHADVATDALWTDELNPTMHGAEAVMAGQAPVNSQLASTASLDTVFGNLTAQYGELATQVIGLAQSVMTSNVALAEALAKITSGGAKQ